MSRNSRADKYKRTAQGYFTQSQKRDELLKTEQEKAHNAEKAKISRLKALRLEREASACDSENLDEPTNS